MAYELRDRAAVVTGGRRIGGAVALDLARRGMDVALCFNRSREEADATAQAVRSAGRRAVVSRPT
jgi:3-oxoacyl-[acyl-carrier protein] reductase